MMSPEQFTALYSAQGRAAQRFAAVSMEAAQHLLRVQMEAGRDVLERNGARWRDTVARLDGAPGTPDWPALMQAQLQFAIEATRTTFEGAQRVGEAYVRTMQEQGRAVAEAYRDAPSSGANETSNAIVGAPLDAAGERDNDHAAAEVGRRAAEAVSVMAGQPTGAVAAAQTPPSAGEEPQRRRTIIRP